MESNGPGYVEPMPKCIGMSGRLFGHKFHTRGFLVETYQDNLNKCQRCGYIPK